MSKRKNTRIIQRCARILAVKVKDVGGEDASIPCGGSTFMFFSPEASMINIVEGRIRGQEKQRTRVRQIQIFLSSEISYVNWDAPWGPRPITLKES